MASFYSNCTPLAINCYLYSDPTLTNIVPAGYYSNGIDCYQADINGKIIAITTCTVPCDLAIVGNIITTDPTTLGGTNGTITINFTTSNGPSTYTLNGGPPGPAVSPLVINGLSSNIDYTVIITDSNNCSIQATLTLGQTATLFDADWIMVTYQFTDGLDLDTRTRIVVPDVGQDTQPEYLGWFCKGSVDLVNPVLSYSGSGSADPTQYIMLFGNDNLGTGFESILINVQRLKVQQPLATNFTVDLRAFWFSSIGVQPVIAAVTLWKGGVPIHNGCINDNPYCWTNIGATFTGSIDSVPKVITLAPSHAGNERAESSGERVATLKYNLNTYVAVLNNADVTTPSV